MDRRGLTAVLVAAALAACTRGESQAEGAGRPVARGAARALRASADGSMLAFLEGCEEVKAGFLPPQTANCTLRVVPASGGEPVKVAEAVTTLPHGFGWSREGATLAALAGYDYASGSGTLVRWSGGAGREVARDVTFHGFVAGALAAISGGQFLIVRDGAPEVVDGTENVSTFEFEPAGGTRVLLRRAGRAGGALLALEGGVVREIAPATGEYGFAPSGGAFAFTTQGPEGWELRLATDGAARTATAGRQVRSFAFSPDGGALAFLAEARPGEQGNLHLLAVEGGPDRILGRDVGEYRWASRAPRLAWLEKYDPRVRSGVLGAGGPGLPPRTFGRNVSDFALSPDGVHLAFLQHTTRGGYSVDLGLARLDAPAEVPPATIAHGVFGFAFSPDGNWLYYRTRCVRNAEACDLERVPSGGLPEGGKPELIAQGVKSFEFDPRDPGRLLIGFQRMDLAALDIAVWKDGKLTSIDRGVLPGTAQFLGPDSRRVGYVVMEGKREGVYVAEVP